MRVDGWTTIILLILFWPLLIPYLIYCYVTEEQKKRDKEEDE